MLIIIRSVIYNVLFYLNLLVHMVLALPTLLLPRRMALLAAQSWGRSSLWLLRVICGLDIEVRGLDKVPEGGALIASKHQSTWETFALLPLFDDPAFILKRELMWIPIFGWYNAKVGMIPVDRGARSQALTALAARAREAFDHRRQIIIFPEGTRRPPGAEPKYKFGVVHLYAETGATCVPVALNSGLFWRRRSFLRHPGTVVVEILDPIPPGLDKETFKVKLQTELEAATARLIEEGRRSLARAERQAIGAEA